MPFQQAGAAEVVRAAQKDDSFIHRLKSCVSDIAQQTIGTRRWLDIHKHVDVLCEATYYGLTTLSLRQTLGEEYTGVLQVGRTKKRLPNRYERVAMVALQCFGPEVLRRLILQLEVSTRSGSLSTYLRPELKNFVLRHMSTLRYTLTLIHRVHLASFYFSGAFYHISKRITGIKYVMVREWLGDNTTRKSFRMLSVVLLLHILLSTTYSLYLNFTTKIPEETKIKSCHVDKSEHCALCLERRQHTSVTPCGHLFCWGCIHQCLQTAHHCPLCRHPTLPRQVIAVINAE